MQFGRLEQGSTGDFSLKQDHKNLEKVLGGTRVNDPKVYVGGVLWADERFKGIIYPTRAKASDYVKHYTSQFNTIELNATHYRIPSPETLIKWKETAPSGFKFCPKINQAISHANLLGESIGLHNESAKLFGLLEEKLGPCFMQLPPYFSPRRLSELVEFLDNSELRHLNIELRHEDWFKEDTALNYLCNFLYKNQMSLVITDTPGRRDVVHMRLTNRTAMIRFKAVNQTDIDRRRMHVWILRAKNWIEKGLEEFYFFIHTEDKSHMPYLAVYFIETLEKETGIALKAPFIFKTGEEPDL